MAAETKKKLEDLQKEFEDLHNSIKNKVEYFYRFEDPERKIGFLGVGFKVYDVFQGYEKPGTQRKEYEKQLFYQKLWIVKQKDYVKEGAQHFWISSENHYLELDNIGDFDLSQLKKFEEMLNNYEHITPKQRIILNKLKQILSGDDSHIIEVEKAKVEADLAEAQCEFCEECGQKATRSYQGRHLCQLHYDEDKQRNKKENR
jgi:hypothetical protein